MRRFPGKKVLKIFQYSGCDFVKEKKYKKVSSNFEFLKYLKISDDVLRNKEKSTDLSPFFFLDWEQ